MLKVADTVERSAVRQVSGGGGGEGEGGQEGIQGMYRGHYTPNSLGCGFLLYLRRAIIVCRQG